jgi:hypothetical protein
MNSLSVSNRQICSVVHQLRNKKVNKSPSNYGNFWFGNISFLINETTDLLYVWCNYAFVHLYILYISMPIWPNNNALRTIVDHARFFVFRVDNWVQRFGHQRRKLFSYSANCKLCLKDTYLEDTDRKWHRNVDNILPIVTVSYIQILESSPTKLSESQFSQRKICFRSKNPVCSWRWRN